MCLAVPVRILKKIDEVLVENMVNAQLNQMISMGEQVMPGMDVLMKQQAMDELAKQGGDRYVPIIDELLDSEYDVKVVITDENINKASMAQALQGILGTLASAGMPIKKTIRELFDVLGLPADLMTEDMPQVSPVAQQAQITQGQQMGALDQSMPQPSETV